MCICLAKARGNLQTTCKKESAAIERTSTPKYLGVYDRKRLYHEGNMCTHDGSVWHANKTTNGVPGDGSPTGPLLSNRLFVNAADFLNERKNSWHYKQII